MSEKSKIISHSVKPFRRFGIEIKECLWLDGNPYFTAAAIADWLELKSKADGVNQIVRRCSYIKRFSKEITVTAEVTQKTRKKSIPFNLKGIDSEESNNDAAKSKIKRPIEMRIYDPVGLQLIAMESRTKKAQEYKVAAAKVLWAFFQGKLVDRSPAEEYAEQILEKALDATRYIREQYLKEFMIVTGCSRATAFRAWKKARENESPFDKEWKNNVNYIKSKGYEMRIRELFFQNPGIGAKKIYKMIGSPESPALTTVKKFVRKLRAEAESE
jgi:prophage antirepressor-like protein